MARKYYYAIAEGSVSPAITQCWSVASSFVSGYPNNWYKGFSTFPKAREYLLDNNFASFYFVDGPADGPKGKGGADENPSCHAVSKGSDTGIFSEYKTGAEPQVKGFSHACHKSFASKEDGVAFLDAMAQMTTQLADKTDALVSSDAVANKPSVRVEDPAEDDNKLDEIMHALTLD